MLAVILVLLVLPISDALTCTKDKYIEKKCNKCAATKYISGGVCKTCPTCKKCTGTTTTTDKCAAGEYVLAGACKKCDHDSKTGFTCNKCTRTCASGNKIVGGNCVACGKRDICDGTAVTKKKVCTTGNYRDADGSCKACPAKHTCADKFDKVACDAAKYILSGVCTTCPACKTCDGSGTITDKCTAADKYVVSGECKACAHDGKTGFTCNKCTRTCASGKKLLSGNCVACGLREICDGTATTTKKVCTAGNYRHTDGSCKACPAGHTCADKFDKVACDAAKYILSGVCTTCPACKACDGSGTTTDKCAADQYVVSGACKACAHDSKTGFTCNKCTRTCASGKKLLSGNCVACGLREICDGTATTKKKVCTAGNYRHTDGSCKACPAKHTCADKFDKVACDAAKYILSGVCTTCPACKTCDGSGTTTDKCAAGEYVLAGACKKCDHDSKTGFTCTDKCARTCASGKKILSGNCVACGKREICDGTATTKKKVCTATGNYRDADGSCKACPAKHTCADKFDKVACDATDSVGHTDTCTDCPAGHKCDGKTAVKETTAKPKVTKAPDTKTTPKMADANALSIALPLFITAFASIVV